MLPAAMVKVALCNRQAPAELWTQALLMVTPHHHGDGLLLEAGSHCEPGVI